MANPALTGEQIIRFHQNGYLALRDLLPQEDLQPLVDELAEQVEVGVQEAIAEGVLKREDA